MAAGMVLVGLYSDSIAAPASSATLQHTSYPDGAVIEYDYAAHALAVQLPGGGTATVVAPGGVTIDSPQTTITGACTVQGLLSYQGGMAGSGSAGGSGAAASITGSVNVTGDVTASGISLASHTHGGVRAGGDSTGAPK
jgi:phage baseplate assembly protein V